MHPRAKQQEEELEAAEDDDTRLPLAAVRLCSRLLLFFLIVVVLWFALHLPWSAFWSLVHLFGSSGHYVSNFSLLITLA